MSFEHASGHVVAAVGDSFSGLEERIIVALIHWLGVKVGNGKESVDLMNCCESLCDDNFMMLVPEAQAMLQSSYDCVSHRMSQTLLSRDNEMIFVSCELSSDDFIFI